MAKTKKRGKQTRSKKKTSKRQRNRDISPSQTNEPFEQDSTHRTVWRGRRATHHAVAIGGCIPRCPSGSLRMSYSDFPVCPFLPSLSAFSLQPLKCVSSVSRTARLRTALEGYSSVEFVRPESSCWIVSGPIG